MKTLSLFILLFFLVKNTSAQTVQATATLTAFDKYCDSIYNLAANSDNQYKIYQNNHKIEVFQWQLYSSKIIFALVILVVIIGLVFSGLQFYSDYKTNKYYYQTFIGLTQKPELKKLDSGEGKKVEGNIPEEQVSNATNTLEISKSGIKISSSVIGLIILTLSLVFFFLYLHVVYPIDGISPKKF